MFFGHTLGASQKHFLKKFDEDSPALFTSLKEMLQLLALIPVSPGKVRIA
jgi:hypothetical protein